MLKLFEAPHGDVITLFDHEPTLRPAWRWRCVAVARKIPSHGWQVKGYALGWIDKGARKNVFGISSPEFLSLKRVSQVRQLFAAMARSN